VTLREKKRDRSRETTFRRVPLTPFLKTVLSEWLGRHPGGQFTFCRTDGRPLREGSVGKLFRWIVRQSKWEVMRGWHVLRHSFCSNCAAKGIDQRLIDEWMGHETEEMRRRYRHLFPDVQQAAIEAVFGKGE
jgi:integrase